MRHLSRRVIAGWVQFWTETVISDSGFLELIVNLAYLGKLRPPESAVIVVLVNSRREALLLRLLRLATVIPWCRVRVIHQPADLRDLADHNSGGRVLLVATSQLFSKQHQAVVALRRQFSLVVI